MKNFFYALPLSKLMIVSMIVSIVSGIVTESVLVSILSLLIVWLIIFGIFTYMHSDMLIYVKRTDKYPPGFRKEIKRSFEEIWNILEGKDLVKDKLTLERFTRMFFESGRGSYIGVESRLPSEFMEVYPSWLDIHAKYLQKLSEDERKTGGRILIVNSYKELYDDYYTNPDNFGKFMTWHEDNKTGLYYIVRGNAERIKDREELDTTDVALWEAPYAVTFEPTNKFAVRLRLIRKEDEIRFNQIKEYVNEIVSAATQVNIKDLMLVERTLAENWKGYTGSLEERRKIHKFIHSLLKEYQNYKGRILDVAAGIGNEAIYLLKNDFDVEINEVDPNFYEMLRQSIMNDKYLKEKGFTYPKLHVYRKDWRKLSEAILPGFSAILALGNSLSMVTPKKDIITCIKQFYRLLSPGGKLIVDERNFPKILKKLKAREKVYGRSVMFPGNEVKSDLELATNGKDIIFNFFKDGKHIGDMKIACLKKGELKIILENVGFDKIEVYSDLELKTGPDPNADFYTYIAIKPENKST